MQQIHLGQYHTLGHKTRSYILHIDQTAMLYTIYCLLNDGILVIVRHFVFYAHAHYS